MALRPRSSRVKGARSLSQKRPKKIYGNLSLFSHQPVSYTHLTLPTKA